MKNNHPHPHLEKLTAAYQAAISTGTSRSSQRAYRRDLKYFWNWLQLAQAQAPHYPVDVTVILAFVLDHTGTMDPLLENQLIQHHYRKAPGPLRISTLRRYLASISIAHSERGHISPTGDSRVKLLLRRLQRANNHQGKHKKAAITVDILRQLIATCDDSLIGLRDHALLLTGFASGGRRRSELAVLQITDLRKVSGGYLIRIRSSKTDQDGHGQDVPILGEAATALSSWLIKTGLRDGKLFRGIKSNGMLTDSITGQTVNRVVKKRIKLIGLNEKEYGAHSLRSGFITESGRQGTHLRDAMALSGHKTSEVAQEYYREGELLRNPSAHLY